MKINFTLDDQRLSLDVSSEESAFSVIRKTETGRRIRWRCLPGSCVGLCTILLNEQPVIACSVPATQLDNSAARTLSSIPLNRLGHYIAALSASGSTACGYCSPNLILLLHHLSRQDAKSPLKLLSRYHPCRRLGVQSLKRALRYSRSNEVPTIRIYSASYQRFMLGQSTRIYDIRTRDMLFAVPFFAPFHNAIMSNLRDNTRVISLSPPQTPIPQSDIAFLMLTDVLSPPVPQPVHRFSKSNQQEPLEDSFHKRQKGEEVEHTNPVEIKIPFTDPGHLEPDAVFVSYTQKQIHVASQSPSVLSHIAPDFEICSLASSTNCGGIHTPNLVRAAYKASMKCKRDILLTLTPEESLRVRPKRVSQKASCRLVYQAKSIVGISMQIELLAPLDFPEYAPSLILNMIEEPYFIDNISGHMRVKPQTYTPCSLQRGLSLEGITLARELAFDRLSKQEGIDPFSLRSGLLSRKHQKILWSLSEAYVQAYQKGKIAAVAIASSPLGLGIKESVETTILVESSSRMVIYTGFPDPVYQMKLAVQLQRSTGLPLDAIDVQCSSAFQTSSGTGIADRPRWLGSLSMQNAIEKLQKAMHHDWGFELLAGQWFVGTAHYDAQNGFATRGLAVAVGIIDASGQLESLQIATDIGSEPNPVWAKGHAENAAQQGVSLAMGEGFRFDEHGLPPKSMDQLSILRLEDSPSLSVHLHHTDGCVPFADSVFCAAFAATKIAYARYQSQAGEEPNARSL